MALKACVLFLTGKFSRLTFDQNLLFTLGLAQVGEFAFVLFSFIHQLNILSVQWTDMMMGVTPASMTVTPVLLLMTERFILPRFGTKEKEEKDADTIDVHYPVIIAGFGHFGSTIGRFFEERTGFMLPFSTLIRIVSTLCEKWVLRFSMVMRRVWIS